MADIRPYGCLDAEQLAALEADLGRPLPATYRSWLAATNGAFLMGPHGVPGLALTLFDERPLLGVHPEYPPFDLMWAEKLHRRPWLSSEHVVVAVPSGGLLTVRMRPPIAGSVHFLPEDAMTGQPGDVANAARERHLVPVADDIGEFGRMLRADP